MNDPVHRTPTEAWDYLKEHGGIEIDGRDAGLDQRIHQRLDPAAPSLEAALAATTMEAFCRAFFDAVHPYVAMFTGILDFFKQAGATEGPAQWALRVDNVDLDLEHFRKWLNSWTALAKATLQIPAIDERGLWRLWEVFSGRSQIRDEVMRDNTANPLNVAQDVLPWIAEYNRGNYTPLPNSLLPPQCPHELRTTASIARAMLLRLLEQHLTRSQWRKLYKPNDPARAADRSDAFNFWTILQSETDNCLRTLVVSLAAAAAKLRPEELHSLGVELDGITDRYPVRPFETNVPLDAIESVLSLPIWKKRYELYSVWVATEMIRALDGHDVRLHHDNGRIEFAFRETVVATILSSPGPFRLISERRSPLADPQGLGRSANVQPDHGLWRSAAGGDICELVAEVKHYKHSAKTKFVDVFEDYARALPEAQIYLVNHGPTGNAVYDVSRGVRKRCHAIASLTPSNLDARKEFSDAIRKCVGKPLAAWPRDVGSANGLTNLVSDVSGSMQSVMRSPAMNAFVRLVAAADLPRAIVAADERILGSWPATEAGFAALLNVKGDGTALGQPVTELLASVDYVVVVTDSAGQSTLNGLDVSAHPCQGMAPEGVIVSICRKLRQPSGLNGCNTSPVCRNCVVS